MLRFEYNDYRVYIDDTGEAKYELLDDSGEYTVVTDSLPREIVSLADSILQLVATDVVKAEMRIAKLRKELRKVDIVAGDAEYAKREAIVAQNKAMGSRASLTVKLEAAEADLQLISAG